MHCSIDIYIGSFKIRRPVYLKYCIFCFSDRMSAISGFHVRRVVQKVGRRFRDIGTLRKLQRVLHLVHPDASGVAEVGHRHIHVVSSDANLYGTGCYATRVGH